MLPAQAGVILLYQPPTITATNAPRAGGGDPKNLEVPTHDEECSPRRRG